jgi:uncharacterized protein YcbX
MAAEVSPTTGSVIGTVSGLWRYPVKSMAAEPLGSAEISWAGLTGDRRWAFLRPEAERNDFPWHTIREYSLMCRYLPRFTDPAHPDKSEVDVQTPGGATLRVHDPALAAELGPGVRVVRMGRGTFDAMPLSLITTATVSDLCELTQLPSNALRFRPNLLITTTDGQSFVEDEWVGSVLQIGDAAVRVDARDSRCTVVNVDPESGQVDAQLLKTIGKRRQARAGVYGTIVRPGRIQVGDPVRVAG